MNNASLTLTLADPQNHRLLVGDTVPEEISSGGALLLVVWVMRFGEAVVPAGRVDLEAMGFPVGGDYAGEPCPKRGVADSSRI